MRRRGLRWLTLLWAVVSVAAVPVGSVVAVGIVASRAAAEPVIPLPQFSEYRIPDTAHPAPPSSWAEYVDLGFLVVALAASTAAALFWRRRGVLLVVTIVALVWLGFWRKGCVCPIGATQHMAEAAVDPTYAISWTVAAWFALPIIAALLFGRTFCGAVCPLGAIQELVAIRPRRVPEWLDHALGLVPFFYLGTAVLLAVSGAGYIICRYDPFVGFFRRSGELGMIVFGGALLMLGLVVGRPYCRYLCPYGAILSVAARLARWHVRIAPEACVACRLCEDACPYGAIREPTVAQTSDARRAARRRLGWTLAALPLLVALGALLGSAAGRPLAQLHPTVWLAEIVAREQAGKLTGVHKRIEAFHATGKSADALYTEADALVGQFRRGARLLGAWFGLVVGVKLVHLNLRRGRSEYIADPARCVSCGRCFWYCPLEQARRGWITEADQQAWLASLEADRADLPGRHDGDELRQPAPAPRSEPAT